MSNETTGANRPIETLRDGSLKATIWQNEGENGPYFTTTLAKTFETRDGKLRDGNGFTGSELLRAAELARAAYARTLTLRRAPEAEPEASSQEDEPARQNDPRRRGGNSSGYARRRADGSLSDRFPGLG